MKSYETIPHTDDLSANELSKTEFNSVVLGSDIVWDYSFDLFDHDPFLFGNNFKANKIISYAASFGTIKRGANYPEYVVKGIENLAHISVRDENSADIVEDITGKRPPVVLDPTWLWDFNSDKNIVLPQYDDYIVIYGQDFNDAFINQIIEYAHEKNYKLICLDCNDDNYDWCDVVIRQAQLTPYEWIGLFKGAKTIATSTYHGLTFALIFNKPLAFCRSDFIIAKAKSFLQKLNLYDLFEKEGTPVSAMMSHNWDYKDINAVIDKERNNSINFLKSALTNTGDNKK